MKKLHKILTLCLAVIMMLGIMAIPASAFDFETAQYVIWTEEEFLDTSIPRLGENTILYVLDKTNLNPIIANYDDYKKYVGDVFEVRWVSNYTGLLSQYDYIQAAALEAYNRIDDPEYKARIVNVFGLDIKSDDTTEQPAETSESTEPEAPVSQPVTTTVPETTATTTVTGFSDVKPGDWYYTAVTEFAKTGLLAGYSDGTFRPNNPITGGELATILCRIYGITDAELQEVKNALNAHPDASWLTHASRKDHDDRDIVSINHWALPAMWIACDSTGNVFSACMTDFELSRGNVLTALVSMAKDSTWPNGTKPSYDSSDEALKATIANIPDVTYNELNVPERTYGYGSEDPLNRDSWQSKFIGLAYQMGIAHGVDSTGRCDPWGKVTRAQLVQMLYNLGITHYGQLGRYSQTANNEEVRQNQEANGVILGGFASSSTSK